jgi:hypothetical protein
MKTLLLLFSALTLTLAPIRAVADDTRTTNLKAADDERVAATIAADRSRLSAILSDDLHYAHSSGTVDTKTSYIEALTSGRLKYLSMQYEERDFTFPAPGIALMTGRAAVEVGKADSKTAMKLTFLAVWREEQGHWHFLAWQSGKLPEAVPAAGK